MRLGISLVVALLAVGCSGETVPDPPVAGDNDPAFEVRDLRTWYLIGNDLTEGHDTLELTVVAPEGVGRVDAWFGGAHFQLESGANGFTGTFDLSEIPPAAYELLVSADGAETALFTGLIRRSHPLYTIVSNDWDDPDNTETAISLQEDLHDEHPELVLTHFVGPYTFTAPEVSPERRVEIVQWLRGMENDYGDEIGLHIHPFCNFVDTIDSVDCLFGPSTVYSEDPTGYTVMCAAYGEDNFTTLLEASDAIFIDNGLDKPTSFRAGGWTADITTLRDLANTGYVADTSANNWARMEEWEGVRNGVLYEWNMTNWATIDDTSQPYYPSEADILTPGEPAIPVLEVPDNGILVDYVSTQEMIDIFEANWPDRKPLTEPVAYSIGYHPSNFSPILKTRITDALFHVDEYLAVNDDGPVVYETLSNMVKVWKP